jgi:hypothetical protein
VKPVDPKTVGKDEMNQHDEAALTPADEDPVIHRHLAALPAFTPATLFGDRVLSRVWMPEPAWARNVRVVGRDWTDSGRMWLVFGALALGSLIPTAAGVTLVAAFASEIAAGIAWLFDVGLATGAAGTADELAARWSQIAPADALGRLTASQIATLTAGSVALLVGCTWGLRTTMRPRVR